MSVFSSARIEKAKACNLFYLNSSGTRFPAPFHSYEASSEELAIVVAQWQEKHSLFVDGIIGPKTSAALAGHEWTSPQGENYLIVGGKKIPTPFPVVNWTQNEGLSFPRVQQAIPGFNGIPLRDDPRLESIDKFVLHWYVTFITYSLTWLLRLTRQSKVCQPISHLIMEIYDG